MRVPIVALFVFCACSEDPRTQLTLRVDADAALAPSIESVEVCLTGAVDRAALGSAGDGSCATYARTPSGDQNPLAFPFDVALVPVSLPRAFRVRAEATTSGGEIPVVLEGTWLEGETLLLPLWFEEACASVNCGEAQSCRGGACVAPEDVDPCRLLRPDGSRPACGSMLADASVDATIDREVPEGGPEDAMMDADAPDAAPPPSPRIAFVSSAAYPAGSFGDPAMTPNEVASARCQALATDARLAGTFVALLSTDEVNARELLPNDVLGWVNVEGEVVALSTSALLSGELLHPIRYAENRATITGRVMTGSRGDLTTGEAGCQNWTDTDGFFGAAGDPRSTASLWIDDRVTSNRRRDDCNPFPMPSAGFGPSCTVPCSDSFHLYCFQIDGTDAVEPPVLPADPRLAFVTRDPVLSGGGLTDLDAHCEAQRPAFAPAEATFVALVSPQNAPAISRVSGGGPWHRLDGVLVGTRTDLAGGELRAPITVTQDGAQSRGLHWAGALNIDRNGGAFSCLDWESGLGGAAGPRARVGLTASTHVFDGFNGGLTVSCPLERAGYRLLCFDNR